MLSNGEVAERLEEIADLLDLLGERFKPEAYRRAARSIEALPEALGPIAARDELRSIPGVGEAIAGKVTELLRTGSLEYLEGLRARVPAGVLELMRLPGVGPKTARRFWIELGIEGPAALARAIEDGRLAGVKGFAEKKTARLRSAVRDPGGAPATDRVPLETVWPLARSIVAALRAVPGVQDVAMAGSFRRARETVGDLDVLVTTGTPEAVFDTFSALPEVGEVRLRGPTKETVVLRQGLQVDLRVVEPESFGAALTYFTGSKDHNVRLRSLARDRGLKVNEYGVYRGEERIAGRNEQEVYRALGLDWIPPELREDRGEIDLAAAGRLPKLVEPGEIRSDLHVHLPADAGREEVERLAAEAGRRGLAAVGVIVATVDDGRVRDQLRPDALETMGRPARGAVRLMAAVEVAGEAPWAGPNGPGGPVPEYLVWRAAARRPVRASLDPGSVPVRVIAHLTHATGPGTELFADAARLRAGVEVGPGPGRLDSTGARAAREAGAAVVLPTGVGRPTDDPTGPVALGWARRAGAGPGDVLNTRAEPGKPEPAGATTARGRVRGRRKR